MDQQHVLDRVPVFVLLDIRIRLEGWEVELELKAERERLLQLHQPAVEFSMDAPEKVEAAT